MTTNAQKFRWGGYRPKVTAVSGPSKGLDPTNPLTGTSYTDPATGGLVHNSIPAPQPVDPNLEQQKLTAGRNIALGNADAAYQSGNLSFDYGYNPDGSVNASNPYSRATLYQLAHANQQRGNTNSFASRGQLYSGALVNAQSLSDQSYAQNEAANRLAFQRALHGVQAGQLGTYANNALGVGQGDFDALLRATYPGS